MSHEPRRRLALSWLDLGPVLEAREARHPYPGAVADGKAEDKGQGAFHSLLLAHLARSL